MSGVQRVVTAGLVAAAAGLAVAAAAQQDALRTHDVALHYWPGQAALARSLLPGDAVLAFPGLPADVLRRGETVNVFLAPDPARWDSLTGGRAPEWGAGVAIAARNMIVIPGYVSSRGGTHALPTILRHELAHVALHRTVDQSAVPRWFNEGYATWMAGQFNASDGWRLRLAFVTRRAPPLDSISLHWPLIEADARLAYGLSASAVRYLHSLGSDATFERFIANVGEHGDFERAMREVYVLTTPQFERLWRTHVRRSYGWLQIVAQSMFVWVILTILVLVLFVVRRRRDRKRLRALNESELPDEPAYWLDPPEPAPPPGQPPAAPRDDDESGPSRA